MGMSRKHFRDELDPSCATLHGVPASSTGFGIALFTPRIIGDANGHGAGHRVNELTTSTTSGGPGPSWYISPASLTPKW